MSGAVSGNLFKDRLISIESVWETDFADPIIESIERKVEISKEFSSAFDNKALAVM